MSGAASNQSEPEVVVYLWALRSRSNRAILGLTIACVVSLRWSSAYAAPASDAADVPAATVVAALERIVGALEKHCPAVPPSVAGLAAQQGSDPAKLAKWIEQETAWVPYHGSLRGPEGVLLDRAGNTLDRALLLAQLIESSGFQARLLHRQLSESEAAAVLRTARTHGPKRGSAPPPADPGRTDLARYAADIGADPQAVQRAADAAALDVERRTEDAHSRVAEQSAALLAAVGPHWSTEAPGESAEVLAAARDHWWVQYQDKQTWIDLDPLAQQPFKADSTLVPVKGRLPDKSALRQELQIRVICEQWTASKLTESVVLDTRVIPAETLGRRVVLTHCPGKLPRSAEAEKDDELRLRRIAAEAGHWIPVLSVVGNVTVQKGFTTTGDVTQRPTLDPVQNLAGATGGLMGGFGGDEGAPKDAVLCAVWVEYALTAPNGKPRTIRREVFDLIGPAARAAGKPAKPQLDDARKLDRGLALLGRIEILPLPCDLTDAFVNNRMDAELAAGLKSLLARARAGEFKTQQEMAGPAMETLLSLQGPLYNWARTRNLWSTAAGQSAPAAINLVNYRVQIVPSADGKLEVRRTMDILTNDRAATGSGERDVRKIMLAQGVSDTVAECFALGGSSLPLNTSHLMSLSATQRIGWSLVRDAADPGLAQRQLPADVLARVRADLAAGNFVMLPDKPVTMAEQSHLAWWRIDARTGQSIGVIESGLNGTVEDLITRINAIAMAAGRTVLFSGHGGWLILRAMTILEFMQYMGLNPSNPYQYASACSLLRALGGNC